MSTSPYSIAVGAEHMQHERIHQFLSTKAYWCLGIPRETVDRAIQHSLCFGAFEATTQTQVAFARVVTDQATVAWLCDVYVEDEHRGRGIASALMSAIVALPQLQGLRRFCLTTKDAHSLYQRFGFSVTQTPHYWMEIKRNDVYRA